MAKQIKKQTGEQSVLKEWNFPFDKQSYLWLGIALGVIIIGYLLMATGIGEDPAVVDGKWSNPMAVNVAPVLLVIAYCVLVPIGIMGGFRKKTSSDEQD